jgi:hypothetical protein
MDDDEMKTVVGGQAVAPGHAPPPGQSAPPEQVPPPSAPTAPSVQDQLINLRLTWLGTFSGFLIAATAFASNNSSRGFVIVICIMGALAGASIFVGTLGANLVLWRQTRAAPWDQPYPKSMFWLMPGTVLPILIFLFWVIVPFVS